KTCEHPSYACRYADGNNADGEGWWGPPAQLADLPDDHPLNPVMALENGNTWVGRRGQPRGGHAGGGTGRGGNPRGGQGGGSRGRRGRGGRGQPYGRGRG